MNQELKKILNQTLPDVELDKNVCVYLHIDTTSQEVFYVGMGNKKRPYNKCNRGVEWLDYVCSICFNYDIVVLYENLNYIEANEMEIKLIAQIGRKDKGLGNLLNKTDGGSWTEKYAKFNKRYKQIQTVKQILKLENFEKIEKEIINKATQAHYYNEKEFCLKNPNDYNIAIRFGFIDKVHFTETIEIINKSDFMKTVQVDESESEDYVETMERAKKFLNYYYENKEIIPEVISSY